MLHDGSLLTNEETDSLKNKIHKIQMAFKNSPSVKTLTEMNVQIISQVGNYFSVMARGDIDEIMESPNRRSNPDSWTKLWKNLIL